MRIELSDFSKRNVMACYGLMKDFMHDNVESEENYANLLLGLEKLRIGIPEEIYAKIIKFVDEELAPLVYESDKVFAVCDKVKAEMKKDIKEEDIVKIAAPYLDILFNVEEKLDDFGMKELHPYLV